MIDLHLHLDGSLPVETVLKIAEMDNITLPTIDKELLRQKLSVSSNCKDLTEYLEKFDLPLQVLQTKNGLRQSVLDLLDLLERMGLIYVEIRFAPQLHTRNGLTMEEVVKCCIDAIKEGSNDKIKANLILCCMRGAGNDKENFETVDLAKKYLNNGVVAVDLAGAEAIWTTDLYEELFDYANKLNVPFTIHAGEACGAESVKLAIKYGAKRIGHGVRCIEDMDVVKELIDKNIYLEVCPKSNYDTKTFKDMKDYPVRKLLDMGVKITINTDDMTVSNTNMLNEYQILMNNFGFDEADIYECVLNSIDCAFISDEEKQELRKKLENIAKNN